MRRKTFLTIIVLLLIGIAIYQNKDQTSSLQTIQREEVAEVGFKAPRFTLTSLDKKSFSVPSSKPVIINFWASWCGPCRLEAPTLKKLNEKYQGAIEVYGVNLTRQRLHS